MPLVAGPWEVAVTSGRCRQCQEPLAVAAAGRVCPQGSESSNEWCLVPVFSSVMTPEVIRAAGGSFSWIPSGGSHPPLGSELAHWFSHTRRAPLPKSLQVPREGYSCSGPTPPLLAIPHNGALLLLLVQATLFTFIQPSFGSPRHHNQRRKRNKRNPNWKARSKMVTACR